MSGILIANWKENGLLDEAKNWISQMSKNKQILNQHAKIVVSPPFTAIQAVSQEIKTEGLSIAIGAQDISHFEEGKHTGEISVKMVKELATYVIVGHSERRADFGDTDERVSEKAKLAESYGLKTIVCISAANQVIALKKLFSDFVGIIAYEPLFAIGNGNPDTPENSNAMAGRIKEIFPVVTVIYGGSVDGTNIKSFLEQENLSGALIGHRSLDPNFFLEIVKNAY